MSAFVIPKGTPVGLSDSNGKMLHVGDKIKGDTCSPEVHGDWVMYEIKLQGLTPIMSYITSEKGQIFSEGYSASILANEYDHKSFVFATDPSKLFPMDRDLYRVEGDNG